MTEKSRHISIIELLAALQFEYIVCLLRKKTFPFKDHRDFWEKTAKQKKEKILDISKKNFLECIFSSEDIMSEYKDKVYNKNGLPNYYYRDEDHKQKQERWDIINYYYKGSDVRVNISDKMWIGKVTDQNVEFRQVDIKLEKILNGIKDIQRFSMKDVTRIF